VIAAQSAVRCLVISIVLLVAAGASASRAVAAGSEPSISARAAVLVDARDGSVLYSRARGSKRPIASTTKLMTALIALQQLRLGQRLSAAPYHAAAAESIINLRPGERMSVKDLLRALLLESANDAAVTLARGVSGSVRAFVARMNERAQVLGLRDTHYANPVGIDESGNYSSALDLSILARRLLRNKTFAAIVNLPEARLRTGSRPRLVENRNTLVASVPWIDGVKTGHTSKAGWVLVGAGKRKGVSLVSVVLGDVSETQRNADTLALLHYGFDQYRVARPVSRDATLARAKVKFFGDRKVPLVAPHNVRVPLRSGQSVRTRLAAPDELEGPLSRGTRVGTVTVFKEGRRLRVVQLVTAEGVPEAGFARKFTHSSLAWLSIVAVLALAVVASRRRRARKTGRRPQRVVT
jgi:D-alanyl-D-alanine carboxypeptidase (penicillin-binding protein 5/6)